ncbi:hypothetical protein CHS0354_037066 [Potamilus streckersoni]|uniref:Uncharacterized protein n=1 Tax=Potamilus streckersoni TaxID=2493646 RepID=A0AAE0SAS8_9BIVA|nr:hypothetical protein CHS0354_037066 [Potamilus streckersoni]
MDFILNLYVKIITDLHTMSGVELTQLTKLSEKEQQQQHYENPVLTGDVNLKVDFDNVYTDMVDCLKPNAQPDLEVGNGEHRAKEEELNGCKRCVLHLQTGCYNCIEENKRIIKNLTFIALFAGYFVYFGYAIYHRFGDEGSHRLLGFTIFAVILIIGKIIFNMYRVKVNTVLDCVGNAISYKRLTRLRPFARW